MRTQDRDFIDLICYEHGTNEDGDIVSMQNTRDESYKLGYVYKGTGKIEIRDKTYELREGCSFVIFPYTSFTIRPGKDLRCTWIEFAGYEASVVLSRVAVSKSNPVLYDIGIDGFEKYYELPEISDEPYAIFRRGGRLTILLSYYYEKYPNKTAEVEGYVIKARRVIEENYTDHYFGVRNVAERLKINRSYLYRLFKDQIGVSVMDYITLRRLRRAEFLLAIPRLTVKDVAYSSGFSDQMYFSRVFKKHCGKTPSEFREEIFRARNESEI